MQNSFSYFFLYRKTFPFLGYAMYHHISLYLREINSYIMDSNKNDAMKMQEENRQARTLENMEIKLSEQMEMMKQLITTSAVISIDELCFHFRTAVQTESVNVPLHLSFERHFKLLIDYARNDRNVLSGLLHCLNSLYECYRTVTPEYYFDRGMTRAFQD